MKKIIIALIAFFTVIVISLTIILIIVINKDDFNFSNMYLKTNLVNTQNIQLDNVDSISIEYKSDDIVFYPSDTNELVLKEYMSFAPTDDELAVIKKNDSNLTIKSERKNFQINFFGSSYYCRTEIYLPIEYIGELSVSTSSGDIDTDLHLKLDSFKASSSIGDISIKAVTANTIYLSSSSGNITSDLIQSQSVFKATSTIGDIKLKEVYTQDINISSSSGNISVDKAEGNRIVSSTIGDITILNGIGDSDVSTSSGDITIKNSEGKLQVVSTIGDQKITAISGGGTLKTSSGNLNLEYLEDIPANIENITLSSTIGDVLLALPPSLHFYFSAETSIGDIRTSFDDSLKFNKKSNHATGTIGDDPQVNVQINTTSGNIKLK